MGSLIQSWAQNAWFWVKHTATNRFPDVWRLYPDVAVFVAGCGFVAGALLF